MRKKSISLVVEYLLITLVGVSLLVVAKVSLDEIFNKMKREKEIKEFRDFCIDFNFYLKNMGEKGLYYFPFKVESEGDKVFFYKNKDFYCKLDFEFCDKIVFGEKIVYYENGKYCFR